MNASKPTTSAVAMAAVAAAAAVATACVVADLAVVLLGRGEGPGGRGWIGIVLAGCGLGCATAGLGWLAHVAAHGLRVRVSERWSSWVDASPFAVLPAAGLVIAGLSLLSGRWIAAQSFTPVLRVMLVIGVIVATLTAARWLRRAQPGRGWARNSGWAIVLVATLAADLWLLPRLYPAFHLALAGAFVIAAAVCGARWGLRRQVVPGVAIATGILAGAGVVTVATGVIPGDAVRDREALLVRAPFASKVLTPFARAVTIPRVAQDDLEAARALIASPAAVPTSRLDLAFPDRRRFNVVIVTIEAVRADHASVLGYHRPTTPNLAELAKEATVFEAAYAHISSSPLSIGAMFKGRFPAAPLVGRRDPDGRFPAIATLLQTLGHRTMGVFALTRLALRTVFQHLQDGYGAFDAPGGNQNATGEQTVAKAMALVDGVEPGRAWHLWVHIPEPHAAYTRWPGIDFGPREIDVYDGEIVRADAHLGALLRHLREREDWNRTVVVVHADHGEEFREHGGLRHGTSLHEEQVRVPLVIRVPGAGPRRIARPVGLADVHPTIVQLMGLDDPGARQGRSLLPYIMGEAAGVAPPAPLTYLQLCPVFSLRRDIEQHAVRYENLKLIHDVVGGTFYLYDLSIDPEERRPLDVAEHPEGRRLVALLDVLRASTEIGGAADTPYRDLDLRVSRGLQNSDTAGLRDVLAEALRDPEPARRRWGIEKAVWLSKVVDPALVVALADDDDAGIRRDVALFVACLGAADHLPVAVRLAGDADAEVAAAGAFARAALGDAAVRPDLERILDGGHGHSPSFAIAGLACLGVPSWAAAVVTTSQCDSLAAYVRFSLLAGAVRTGDPDLLIALRDLEFLARGRALEISGIASVAVRLEPAWSAPILRRLLDRGPKFARTMVRARLEQALGRPGLEALRAIQAAEDGLSDLVVQKGLGPAVAALRTQYDAASAVGIVDWGVGLETWRLFRAHGELKLAKAATGFLATHVEGRPKTLLLRLARAADIPTGAPSVGAEIVSFPPRPSGSSSLWNLRLRLKGEPGGGGSGGVFSVGGFIEVRIHRKGKGRAESLQRFPLPGTCILGGESRDFVLPLVLEGMSEGAVRCVARMYIGLDGTPLFDLER